eukprot:9499070-Pyramimonas_sp.AAC.1
MPQTNARLTGALIRRGLNNVRGPNSVTSFSFLSSNTTVPFPGSWAHGRGPARGYSLSPSAIGAHCGYILSPLPRRMPAEGATPREERLGPRTP